jgi:hypothetical protein
MEVLQLQPSGSGPISPLISSRRETSFELIKRYFSRVPSTPSSITLSSFQASPQSHQTSSAATSIATVTDPSLTKNTTATSIPVAYETFQIQRLHVSPNMPMDQEIKDLWSQQIRFRLSAELHHHVGEGPWLQQFMMAGKRRDDLSPFVVITCGDVRTRKKVEKLCKKLKWLRVLAKSYNIKLAALVAEITLTAGPAPLVQGMRAIEDSCSVDVPDSTKTCCGQTIYISHFRNSPASQCTFGGLIEIDGTLYGLTAGHPFGAQNTAAEAEFEMDVGRQSLDWPEESENSENDATSDSDFVFSHDSSDDGEQTSDSSTTSTDPVSTKNTAISASNLPGKDSTAAAKYTATSTQVNVLLPITRSTVSLPLHGLHFNLDWALIDVSNLPSVLPNQVPSRENEDGKDFPILGALPAQFEPCGDVTVLTAVNGPQYGYLNASPASLKIGGSLYDVRLITFSQILGKCTYLSLKFIRDETTDDSFLAPGSSGAFVILDRYVCGFIIASRQDVPWAYMVLIHPVLKDIKKVLKAHHVGFPLAPENAKLTTPPASESIAHIGEVASSSGSRRGVENRFALRGFDFNDLEKGEGLSSNPLLAAETSQQVLSSRRQESGSAYPSVTAVAPRQLAVKRYVWRAGGLFTHFLAWIFLAWIFLACFDFLCKVLRELDADSFPFRDP